MFRLISLISDCALMNVCLLIAAGAYYFFLKKSNKIQDSANASFAALAFARIMQNHGPQEFAPALARAGLRFRQIRFPFHTQASIVLPDLPGSRTAVGRGKRNG
jgi:hypothetical protein